ncbi:MAG: DUF4382 domain-containing protein [Melioribacteraceae bacterium]
MKAILKSLFIFASFIFLSGCDSNTDPSDSGKLNLYMTDAPGDFTEVNVTFSEISVHINNEWVSVKSDPVTINLLNYNNGTKMLLGTKELPSGKYTQIRLIVQSANVLADGQRMNLTIPSGEIKLGPQFTIEDGLTYELVLDFDVARSIVITGPKNNPTGYKLKPVVRAQTIAVTGSISGMVSNHENAPTAFAIQGTDTLTSSFVKSDGNFTLGFLPAGLYKVVVSDTLNKSFTNPSVTVEIGKTNNLGNITLQ